MAADQERADRIRALKKDHPETTWEAIGDHVGVSMRAAQAWQETGGITYENAKKLAELWGVELSYIMRGEGTPDLLGSLNGNASQLDRIESKLNQLLEQLGDTSLADLTAQIRALGNQDAGATDGQAPSRGAASRKRRAS